MDFDVQCGPYYSPCDEKLDCGGCPAGEGCGAEGAPGRCAPTGDASACLPLTCADIPGECGVVGDGCGSEIDCGPCFHWGCNLALDGCPGIEPPAGSACTPEGARCTYTKWTMFCCMDLLSCTGGLWKLDNTQCPE